MAEIQKDIPYIRGLTVSGGECSLRRDFVVELFCLAKEKGLTTLMDSNGTYNFKEDTELLSVCDGVMLDIKAFDEEEHRKLTGQSPEDVYKRQVHREQKACCLTKTGLSSAAAIFLTGSILTSGAGWSMTRRKFTQIQFR